MEINGNGLMEKYEILMRFLARLGSVAVSFSGGVDSTFLLKCAKEALGSGVLAVTARSLSFPKRELDEAGAFCASEGIRHVIVDSEELDIDGFAQNPVNRCYLCKKELFGKIWGAARENGAACVADGSNADDAGDYRPGLAAADELGVLSPLRAANLCKAEIRELSRRMGLPTWNKQSFACLSSRFPYGETITPERLKMIDRAEQLLLDLGFCQARARYHGLLARIEVGENEIDRFFDPDLRREVCDKFKEYGFAFVSLDLLGYRMGSMNATGL